MMSGQKVVIITGASQGIGAGLVKAYRDAGYGVIANSRSIGRSNDSNILDVPGDIGDLDTAAAIVAKAYERFGRIDSLVNNAGIFTGKPFTELTADDWLANIRTNLQGFFFLTQHAISKMEAQGSGHIVQITASIAEQPIREFPAVLAAITKGGLNAATKALAIEYASRGIRVNAVSPGIIRTPILPSQLYESLGKFHPVGRVGEIRDVVDAVMFLENAPFVTGEILHVDGGQSAGHW